MTEAERLAQQAGTELTSLINALRPPALDRKSLPAAVREHVKEWSRQNYIEAKVNIDSTSTIDEQVEQTLFRVLQEALANVARHSKADKVNIELKLENDAVVLIPWRDTYSAALRRKVLTGLGSLIPRPLAAG